MTEIETGNTGSPLVRRRDFLRTGLLAATGLAVGLPTVLASQDAMAAEVLRRTEIVAGSIGGPRTLSFVNTHTNEKLTATYWRGGGYEGAALEEINYILRDFRTGDVHAINPGLLNLLSILNHKVGVSHPVNIISGYRSPRTNAMLRATREGGVANRSFHLRGMAIDIRIPGLSTVQIARQARALQIGGVGYYSDSDFCHVDVGPVRTW